MSYRSKQSERGKEAVDMLVAYLEKVFGLMHVSVNESKYSVGVNGNPDVVFRDYAIEVKRMEFFTRHKFDKEERYYLHQNNLKINSYEWELQEEWCTNNKKKQVLIVVITFGMSKNPIFVGFTKKQIDQMKESYRSRPSANKENFGYKGFFFGINAFSTLREGLILNKLENIKTFLGNGSEEREIVIYEDNKCYRRIT